MIIYRLLLLSLIFLERDLVAARPGCKPIIFLSVESSILPLLVNLAFPRPETCGFQKEKRGGDTSVVCGFAGADLGHLLHPTEGRDGGRPLDMGMRSLPGQKGSSRPQGRRALTRALAHAGSSDRPSAGSHPDTHGLWLPEAWDAGTNGLVAAIGFHPTPDHPQGLFLPTLCQRGTAGPALACVQRHAQARQGRVGDPPPC